MGCLQLSHMYICQIFFAKYDKTNSEQKMHLRNVTKIGENTNANDTFMLIRLTNLKKHFSILGYENKQHTEGYLFDRIKMTE